MPFLIQYILKLSLSLSLVYLFYQLALRRLTFYNWNRFYLFGYTILSFFIPLINIAPVLERNEMLNSKAVLFIPSFNEVDNYNPIKYSPNIHDTVSWSPWHVVSLFIVSGIIVLLLKLLIQFLSFRKMIRGSDLISDTNVRFYKVDKTIIPFSFGNSIFINPALHNEEELKEIVRHEFVHVRQKHTIDIVWAEMVCIFNWYNPFAWIIRKAVRQNLEFIADDKVLQAGIDKKQYQYLLLKVTGNNHFSIASQFNFSSLKKRIAMMNKMKSARVHVIKFLFVLPLIAVLLVAFRNNNDKLRQKKETQQTVGFKEQADNASLSDTVPGKDNYIIEVIVNKKGNTIVVVRDKKSKKETKRMTLEEWDKNKKYYESLYGAIDGIVEDENHPKLITTDDGRNVYKLRKDNSKTGLSQYIEITDDNKVKVTTDGQVENYDLNIENEKEEFEKKYGAVVPVVAPPKAGSGATTVGSTASASPSKVYELSSVSVTTGTTASSSSSSVGSATLAGPASAATTVGPVKEVFTDGKIIAVFKKEMQEADVKKLEAGLKDQGYDFKITKAEYNSSGKLVLIKGHITRHNHKQYFNASDFSRVIITDSPDKNDEDHFNFLVEQGRLSVNDTPEWQ